MIYSITIVTGQGVKTYKMGQTLVGNNKKISCIEFAPTEEDCIYQVLDNNRKVLAEIINCPVEVVYI